MSFKSMVLADVKGVFLNTEFFGEKRTVRYDSNTYSDIPVVITAIKEQDRRMRTTKDHAQGLYMVTTIMHCALSDIGGIQPEKGMKISVNDREGGDGFFTQYFIGNSSMDMGMVRLELEAIDE